MENKLIKSKLTYKTLKFWQLNNTLGQTTNMDTYPAHPPQDRPKPKEKEKYVPPTEKFNVNSVHRY